MTCLPMCNLRESHLACKFVYIYIYTYGGIARERRGGRGHVSTHGATAATWLQCRARARYHPCIYVYASARLYYTTGDRLRDGGANFAL